MHSCQGSFEVVDVPRALLRGPAASEPFPANAGDLSSMLHHRFVLNSHTERSKLIKKKKNIKIGILFVPIYNFIISF